MPDEKGREGIIRVMTRDIRLSGDIEFRVLAKKTPGFVGADIRSLTKEAGVVAINRIFKNTLIHGSSPHPPPSSPSRHQGNDANPTESNRPEDRDVTMTDADGDDNAVTDTTTNQPQPTPTPDQSSHDTVQDHSQAQDIHSITPLTPTQLQPLYVTMQDFLTALPNVQPSSKREGFATVPDVSWENIGALTCVREELTLSVLEPITNPEKFHASALAGGGFVVWSAGLWEDVSSSVCVCPSLLLFVSTRLERLSHSLHTSHSTRSFHPRLPLSPNYYLTPHPPLQSPCQSHRQ